MRKTIACITLALSTGCDSSVVAPDPVAAQYAERQAGEPSRYIKHIIIIVQENRSFENLFAGYPNADAPLYGYTHAGKQVALKPIALTNPADPSHGWKSAIADWDNGKMDGFDTQGRGSRLQPYSYVDRQSVKPYWTMAQSYVLADKMYPTEFGGSFTAHLELIAGTDQLSSTEAEAGNPSNTPWGCDAPPSTQTNVVNQQRQQRLGPFPCFTQFTTMADNLDAAGVSWKFYAPQTIGCTKDCNGGGLLWSAFDAISAVRYGQDWSRNIVNPETQILKDAANGNLASVSWVVPDWQNSDHGAAASDTGPSWVAAIVNTIGKSKYWNSTAIVALWDDWGGWYDDSPPPQLDYEGLAIRVPCIIISPYARAGTVSHTQYEFGSILKFAEQTFGLQSLNHTDARATSIGDAFNFKQTPLKFMTIKAKYPTKYFLGQKASLVPPDDE